MKYLKSYEYNHPEYNIGDYIRTVYSINKKENKFFKITHKYNDHSAYYQYDVINSNGDKYTLNSRDIYRYMNDKEIEIFDINLSKNKYNI